MESVCERVREMVDLGGMAELKYNKIGNRPGLPPTPSSIPRARPLPELGSITPAHACCLVAIADVWNVDDPTRWLTRTELRGEDVSGEAGKGHSDARPPNRANGGEGGSISRDPSPLNLL